MPKGDNPDNYKLPALFSRSSFAKELEDVAVAEDMAVRTFASRAQHNKAGRAALLLCDGAAEDENPDGAATGRVVAAGISYGTLGSPDVVAQPIKAEEEEENQSCEARTTNRDLWSRLLDPVPAGHESRQVGVHRRRRNQPAGRSWAQAQDCLRMRALRVPRRSLTVPQWGLQGSPCARAGMAWNLIDLHA